MSSLEDDNDKIETDEIQLEMSPEPTMDKVQKLDKKSSDVIKPFEAQPKQEVKAPEPAGAGASPEP